jgi:hypothetical protein
VNCIFFITDIPEEEVCECCDDDFGVLERDLDCGLGSVVEEQRWDSSRLVVPRQEVDLFVIH